MWCGRRKQSGVGGGRWGSGGGGVGDCLGQFLDSKQYSGNLVQN